MLVIFACSSPSSITVTLVDVGYGTAVLLKDRTTAVLMDGGYAEEIGELENALHDADVESVSVLIASHGHEDHLEGLTRFLENGWPVGSVSGNVEKYSERFSERFWRVLQKRAIPYTKLHTNDEIVFNGIRCEILHPDTLTRDKNASSLVARFRINERTVLIPSDVDVNVQRRLAITVPALLKGDILVLPHHGDLIDPLFLDAVSPRYALLSVGPNPWELPADETLNELSRRDIRLLDTRILGTVTISLEPDRLSVVSTTGPGDSKRREMDMNNRIRRWKRER